MTKRLAFLETDVLLERYRIVVVRRRFCQMMSAVLVPKLVRLVCPT